MVYQRQESTIDSSFVIFLVWILIERGGGDTLVPKKLTKRILQFQPVLRKNKIKSKQCVRC